MHDAQKNGREKVFPGGFAKTLQITLHPLALFDNCGIIRTI
jgi:hypothetical protein